MEQFQRLVVEWVGRQLVQVVVKFVLVKHKLMLVV